jgi:uncharacterized protein (TIGR03790 family)
MTRTPLLALTALVLSLFAAPALAQTADNLLLVVNQSSPDSIRVAEHYARVRGVPQTQVLRVTVDAAADEIERVAFERQIQDPIAAWIRRNSAQDRILFIVLTKGVPLRIRGTSGRNGTQASVDSELTLLYRRLTGDEPPLVGPLANPYFLGDTPVAQAAPFSHKAFDIYLVTRLDGYTVDDVLKLIDRGAAPSRDGRILLDERAAEDSGGGNTWLKAAADWMAGHGFGDRLVLEAGGRVLTGEKNVLGYYSWGSNDPAITMRTFGLGFVPGAIAGMFVSTDARTFREPPAGWATGPWTDRTKFFAGSPQSLSGDLIREGVTGVAGHVAEPYLDATIRPNILFPAYLSGFNLAEAFYLAMPFVSWQTVVVGDPLCAPFPRKAPQPSDIDAGIDPSTGLPALFSARRLRVAAARGVRMDAARLVVRAEVLSAKDDKAGARAALEEATALEPRMLAAQMALARDYELSRDYDKAIERYRLALRVNADDAIALNNLAYLMAVQKHLPADAVGYAERANHLSPGNPAIADTMAWIQHLLGRNYEAAPIMTGVVKAEPANADFRLHAAVIYAAIGKLDEAAAELKEALRLDPSLATNDEVKTLRTKLSGR